MQQLHSDKDCQVSTAKGSDSSKYLVGVMEEMQWAEKVFLNEIHNQSQASITTVKPFPETTDIVIKKTA